ncbi:MAG: thiamine-phosphate kinase [Rhodospirillales bacterium]|nr:thiamine-phosphate kinase [Rhodospirillales bacterium]
MTHQSRPGEFDLISSYFKPLAKNESGALGLTDDAAVLNIRNGHRLVVTMDTLVSGVHFLEFTPPHFIAAKALRVNLSDLAAMGADPAYYTLSLSLPTFGDVSYNEDWLDRFSQALGVEQSLYNIVLVGGDTVSTPGPLSLTISAFGWVKTGQEILRSGASIEDLVFVSGTVGDAMLGLAAVQGSFPDLTPSDLEIITERHHRPQPRLQLGRRLFGLANSAIDISDGLIQDLEHICTASGVTATIRATDIPLSGPGKKLIDDDPDLIKTILSGGDDYELLFTIPPEWKSSISSLAKELGLPLTQIGEIEAKRSGDSVSVYDACGNLMSIPASGYRHF